MNQDRFIIAKKIKEFNLEVLDILINFPKKYQEYRNNLVNDSLDLLETIYYANYSEKGERLLIQKKALAKIEIIRYYIDFAYNKSIITKKTSASLFMKLNDINKSLNAWIKSDLEKA